MELAVCSECGTRVAAALPACPRCGCPAPHVAQFAAQPVPPATRAMPAMPVMQPITHAGTAADAHMIEQIATYERVASIIWLVFGIVQVLSVVAIIAGIWNIITAFSRFGLPGLIRARAPGIPAVYEGIVQLVILAVVNALVGGVIGLLFIAFDFYVRHLVLQNRHLFAPPEPASPAVANV